MTGCNSQTLGRFVVIIKSHAIDELYQRSKKKASRNERTVGGSSATSLRRNIAAIIFKQASRPIFSSGIRRYSNRRLDHSLELFLRLREGYFVENATSHPVPSRSCPPFVRTRRTFLFYLALLAYRLSFRRSRNECGIIHGGPREKEEFSGIEKKMERKKREKGIMTLSSHGASHRRSRPRPLPPCPICALV